MLPHTYPFRFLDQEGGEEEIRLRWTTGGYWSQGRGDLGLSLAVEMMAQAVIGVAPKGEVTRAGLLAGIQSAEMQREVLPGEELIARTQFIGKLGGLVKVAASLVDLDGATVARADLLLAIES